MVAVQLLLSPFSSRAYNAATHHRIYHDVILSCRPMCDQSTAAASRLHALNVVTCMLSFRHTAIQSWHRCVGAAWQSSLHIMKSCLFLARGPAAYNMHDNIVMKRMMAMTMMLCSDNAAHQLSKTIQSTCAGYGASYDYDQSWVCVL